MTGSYFDLDVVVSVTKSGSSFSVTNVQLTNDGRYSQQRYLIELIKLNNYNVQAAFRTLLDHCHFGGVLYSSFD